MENINSPLIVANIDDNDEPTFQGKYKKSVVIERNGRKIGIIGIILSTVDVRMLSSFYSTKTMFKFIL